MVNGKLTILTGVTKKTFNSRKPRIQTHFFFHFIIRCGSKVMSVDSRHQRKRCFNKFDK